MGSVQKEVESGGNDGLAGSNTIGEKRKRPVDSSPLKTDSDSFLADYDKSMRNIAAELQSSPRKDDNDHSRAGPLSPAPGVLEVPENGGQDSANMEGEISALGAQFQNLLPIGEQSSDPYILNSSLPVPEAPHPSPEDIDLAASSLLVMSQTPETIRRWYGILAGTILIPVSAQKNQNLSPLIRSLEDSDLLFEHGVHIRNVLWVNGHCRVLYTRTKKKGGAIEETRKLIEGGTNNDSPRWTPPGATGKVYIYHILARYRALENPTVTINESRMLGVSTAKNDPKPYTIVHLCGHKWCMNENHLDIATKAFNEEQVSCHRGLSSATCFEDMIGVWTYYCRHKFNGFSCWTLNYKSEDQGDGDRLDGQVMWSTG